MREGDQVWCVIHGVPERVLLVSLASSEDGWHVVNDGDGDTAFQARRRGIFSTHEDAVRELALRALSR